MKIPDFMLIYVIGDIHGQYDWLARAHHRIKADARGRKHLVVHLGDLIDRGPNSRGVIEILIRGQRRGAPWYVIQGNHDFFLPSFVDHLEEDRINEEWLSPPYGGLATLASYGIDGTQDLSTLKEDVKKIPENHLAWLRSLPRSLPLGNFFFVHAGIRPGIDLAKQDPKDLSTIRRPFLEYTGDFGAIVVHGHTPVADVTHYGNRINVDTGAGFERKLSTLVLEGNTYFTLTDEGRKPLNQNQ